MSFKNFADGVALTAAEIMTYLMNQVRIICTSGTRPSSPSAGMGIYETDTSRALRYTTATTGFRQDWNMPWGYITQGTSTAATSGITAETDVVTVTFTAVANRRYKLTFHAIGLQFTTNAVVVGRISDTSSNGLQAATINADANQYFFVNMFTTVTPSSGSVTYRGRIGTNLGSLTLQGSVGPPAQVHTLYVEDVGPNGAPA